MGEVGLGDRVRAAQRPAGQRRPHAGQGRRVLEQLAAPVVGAALGDGPVPGGQAGVRPRAVEGQAGGVLGGDADGHLAEAGQLGRALYPDRVGTRQVDPRRPLAQHHALGRPVDGDLQGQAGGPDEGQPAVVGAPAGQAAGLEQRFGAGGGVLVGTGRGHDDPDGEAEHPDPQDVAHLPEADLPRDHGERRRA
ncbi:hypothetical protein J4N02_06090 [Propioniciclava sp. MC1595]|uniref:hypothetical protein n=1 Tax=Propioniciclava sp. MC1595 TaxID=2760308 RepID=UPI001662747F|nr:hypothetical protein [Propioniciclava sp. MC1595]MBB1494475.1 hypothetical protein [Propioniciclava sp. MC1595]QTE27155.1 hypothetical protein J4N02_06090 [Propioniciclava sp. MC1595]